MDDDHEHSHDHPPLGADGDGGACLACPVCVVLQAVRTSSPEVVEHLAAAGRELALALQVVIASHTGRPAEGPERVERIRVD